MDGAVADVAAALRAVEADARCHFVGPFRGKLHAPPQRPHPQHPPAPRDPPPLPLPRPWSLLLLYSYPGLPASRIDPPFPRKRNRAPQPGGGLVYYPYPY